MAVDAVNDKYVVSKPWYREPWPWLLMLGPALAVVGCVITIKLAFDNFSNEAIFDGGVKRGLIIERSATPVDDSVSTDKKEQSVRR